MISSQEIICDTGLTGAELRDMLQGAGGNFDLNLFITAAFCSVFKIYEHLKKHLRHVKIIVL